MRFGCLLCLTALIGAADDLMTAFDPRPTPPGTGWRAMAAARRDQPAEDRDAPGWIASDRQTLGLSWLGVQTEDDEGWLSLRADRTHISGDAQLATGASPAGEYLDLGAGATWKHRLGGGSLVGLMAHATLDGETCAPEGLVWGGTATAFGRVGLGEAGADGLLLALNYDANRVVFSSVPVLPMIAWQGLRGPWILILGVPFSIVTYRAESWRATATVGPLPSLSADHRISGPWRIFGEAKWTRQQWRRDDRPRNDDRLELSQWEWSGGLRLAFGPLMQFDLLGGAATARRLGEDVNSSDARRDGIALEAAPFAAIRGKIAF